MIAINGSPADIAALTAQLPAGGIERQVLNTLAASETTYRYGSEKELLFELNLRREIVNAANNLNKSGLAFAVFRESKANPDYWITSDEGGFQLKSGAAPAAAIRDIYTNGRKYATECATAMQIVYLKALLEIFGDERFNSLFGNLYLMNWHRIHRHIREVGHMSPVKDYLPGDRRYFDNPDVDTLTPEWQGENVIDLGNGTYYGHGMGKRDAASIIAALNRNRRDGARREAYLMQSAGRPNFEKLFNLYSRP